MDSNSNTRHCTIANNSNSNTIHYKFAIFTINYALCPTCALAMCELDLLKIVWFGSPCTVTCAKTTYVKTTFSLFFACDGVSAGTLRLVS